MLLRGLFVTGCSETTDQLVPATTAEDADLGESSNAEFAVQASSAVQRLDDMVHALGRARKGETQGQGLFLFCYRYLHSLNHLLFHLCEVLEAAGVAWCVVPQRETGLHLPPRLGHLEILAVPSLRTTHKYMTLDLERSSESRPWSLVSSSVHDLPFKDHPSSDSNLQVLQPYQGAY